MNVFVGVSLCLAVSKGCWNNTTFCKKKALEYVCSQEVKLVEQGPLLCTADSGPILTDHLQHMAFKISLEFISISVSDKGKQKMEKYIQEAYRNHSNQWQTRFLLLAHQLKHCKETGKRITPCQGRKTHNKLLTISIM